MLNVHFKMLASYFCYYRLLKTHNYLHCLYYGTLFPPCLRQNHTISGGHNHWRSKSWTPCSILRQLSKKVQSKLTNRNEIQSCLAFTKTVNAMIFAFACHFQTHSRIKQFMKSTLTRLLSKTDFQLSLQICDIETNAS